MGIGDDAVRFLLGNDDAPSAAVIPGLAEVLSEALVGRLGGSPPSPATGLGRQTQRTGATVGPRGQANWG